MPFASNEIQATKRKIVLALTGWMVAVALAAYLGLIKLLYLPLIALLVTLGIVVPFCLYPSSPRINATITAVGLFPLTAMHVWRIPAAMVFFWYGAAGNLPPVFWILAGVGDLIAGCLASLIFFKQPTRQLYRYIHIFGFIDFVIAVGTGLTFTLRQDPRMAGIAELPLALIPLFGVGVSGASHLIAFDILRKTSPNSASDDIIAIDLSIPLPPRRALTKEDLP